jgi:dTDP-4-amino-4,6-dideoxygalactose transaminase
MPDPIPLARPSLGDPELAAAERVLRSGRLVMGPEVARFEQLLAPRCRRAHAVAVGSGTAALELAIAALGLGPGDQVLVPAFGFPAAANVLAARGAHPVPVDVDAATWNLDVDAARAALTPRCRALLSIDQLGLVAEAAPLAALALEADLPLIDDAACALGGADSAGVAGGGYGEVATLSFHPRKLITTGEGGAILCDDPELAAVLRQLRNHGQSAPGAFVRFGTNARLPELAGAVGAAQLARLDAMLAERRLLADGYRQRLAPLRAAGRLSWQEPPAGAMHSYQTFAVLLSAPADRDAVRARLAAAGIESGPATYAFHRLPSFRDRLEIARVRAPVADALHDRALALPLYVGMRSGELDRVAAALSEALA